MLLVQKLLRVGRRPARLPARVSQVHVRCLYRAHSKHTRTLRRARPVTHASVVVLAVHDDSVAPVSIGIRISVGDLLDKVAWRRRPEVQETPERVLLLLSVSVSPHCCICTDR